MSDRNAPGVGSAPGIEDQTTATGLGKPSQVPGTPGGPNADVFDVSPEARRLRPGADEGPGDPRAGAGDLVDDDSP